ncbi:hypothetical protein CEP68_12590 [Brevundimonas vesicularis]|uniref:HTH luxR-type domain-containing protein n=1 Tax=Brevundimonas vesicularis TaxID=41276 RepID=A0A1Z3UAK8_BREVE|nr:hypothetical protein CEP68_12590 [Brevundimonas vesicularis]
MELRMLCRPGIGLAAIAPRVCRLAREIVGAEAASLFWLDENAMPLGFFHEDSPEEARFLFVNEFERLFVGEGEINVFALAQARGRSCGHLLTPPASYFRSNTYNLLVRPSGHHHCLDLRIDDPCGGQAVLLLFRGDNPAFNDDQVAALAAFEPFLRRAGTSGRAQWRSQIANSGHLLFDPATGLICAMSDTAETMLRDSNMVGQGLDLGGRLESAPRFLTSLYQPLVESGEAAACIDVPAGRLSVKATLLRSRESQDQVLATLNYETPSEIALIDPVLAKRLSPLRSEMLLFAAAGGARDAVSDALDISKEATKKHLAEIYRVMDVKRWDDLAEALWR